MTTNHCNKHSKHEKVWNILRITKMWLRDTKWAKAVGKIMPIDLLNEGLSQSSICFKKRKKEKQHLQSSIKWSAIKNGMLVHIIWFHLQDGVGYNYRNKMLNSVCQGLGIQGKGWLQSSRRREFQGSERLFYLDCAIGCWLHNTEFLKTYQKHWILPKVNLKSE